MLEVGERGRNGQKAPKPGNPGGNGTYPDNTGYSRGNPPKSYFENSIVEKSGKRGVSPLSGMSEKSDKGDKSWQSGSHRTESYDMGSNSAKGAKQPKRTFQANRPIAAKTPKST